MRAEESYRSNTNAKYTNYIYTICIATFRTIQFVYIHNVQHRLKHTIYVLYSVPIKRMTVRFVQAYTFCIYTICTYTLDHIDGSKREAIVRTYLLYKICIYIMYSALYEMYSVQYVQLYIHFVQFDCRRTVQGGGVRTHYSFLIAIYTFSIVCCIKCIECDVGPNKSHLYVLYS